jgi:predicted DNA-binding transcriptional regulator AlpA
MSSGQNVQSTAAQDVQLAFTGLRNVLPGLADELLPHFLGETARLDAEAKLRLNGPRQASSQVVEDRLLGVKDAAARLDISTSWLYRIADEYPFTIRSGRSLKFSSLGINRWIEKGGRR